MVDSSFPSSLPKLSRRDVLRRIGGGFGALGVSAVFADAGFLSAAVPAAANNPLAPKAPHFAPRAKRVIFLFMNGGPSHVDTFDPKPMLATRSGEAAPESVRKGRNGTGKLMPSNFKFARYGHAGIDMSELYPKLAERADDLCVIR